MKFLFNVINLQTHDIYDVTYVILLLVKCQHLNTCQHRYIMVECYKHTKKKAYFTQVKVKKTSFTVYKCNKNIFFIFGICFF